jgi:hypothetical protein
MGIRHSHFGIRHLSGVGFGLAEAGDAVAVFPLAAFLEDFDALKPLEDAAFAAQGGRGAEATML